MTTFDSTKLPLKDLLKDVVQGKIQLPDFQRGWVWDDEHVRSLLVSLGRSFPVGAVMLLETGGEVRFQVRPVENVPLQGLAAPEKLILDGQQRLTTLTQVLKLSGPVKTTTDKGKPVDRHYYIHIPTALAGPDRLDEAIIATDGSRQQRSDFGRRLDLDLSTRELECKQLYFPCSEILEAMGWLQDLFKFNAAAQAQFFEFKEKVLDAYNEYQIPLIVLKKETSKEAVCLVFEKVNTGGVPLSVFELVTASYAADGYNLRDDWYGSELRKVSSRYKRLAKEPILRGVENTDFLQAVTMLHTLEKRRADIEAGKTGKQVAPVSAKRASVLELPLDAYKRWADPVEQGFLRAAKFLRQECFTAPRDLPYRTQLAPLAAVLALIGADEHWREPRIHQKLAQWFWCGVLGELYGGAVETRIANDVDELLSWIEHDGQPPRTIVDATFQVDRLASLTSRLSAAYKGINVLVLREGAQDLFWKSRIRDLEADEVALDIHHIFPRDWCEKQDIPRRRYDSIINKTPISYKANRMIGGSAPSSYLAALQAHKQVQLDNAGMDALLASHRIPVAALRADDFDSFCDQRQQNLLALIEAAMGKRAAAVETD
ncbi:GmrSD restriction endonuclease domain-containing protein [Xanthomonas axonopodis pv. cassiae]|uniref:GmrSD restriction endonuclease domain-containing protein n=1 Tax=Xanthomonas axonopodis TaxID=53413 RepID=UPI0035592101